MESVTRGLQTVARRSGSHGDSPWCVCGNTGVPRKRPIARDVEACPSLRRDLFSFCYAFGELVKAPHVAHTWPFGWTVGSIGGDALRRTILKLVSHFADIASGPSRVLERFLPGRAGLPLVAATCLHINRPMVGL